jgi:putative spermidine/putrescine transport system ATP-binding protein
MRGELKRPQRQLGISVVRVTHSQDEAMALADLVVVMEAGHIRHAGSARENLPEAEYGLCGVIHRPPQDTGRGKVAGRADRCRLG